MDQLLRVSKKVRVRSLALVINCRGVLDVDVSDCLLDKALVVNVVSAFVFQCCFCSSALVSNYDFVVDFLLFLYHCY
jgi:hypothetical protein